MIIDLHTHTTYSDGKFSVKDLLKRAKQKNIEILAITDHDSVDAHIELQGTNTAGLFDGRIVVGAELNAVFEGAKIELLGYGFEPEQVKKWLDGKYSREKQHEKLLDEFGRLLDLCRRNDIKLDSRIVYDPEAEFPVARIYKEIRKYEENGKYFTDREWDDPEGFFRSCTCNRDFILYLDFSADTPGARECSDVVRGAGGKIFLAHLYKYNMHNHMDYLDKLVKESIIDGIEVYYPVFTAEQTRGLEDYCIKHNLYMSGGTDYHGEAAEIKGLPIWSDLDNLRVDESNVLKWIGI